MFLENHPIYHLSFLKNTKGENNCLPSSPLPDSSNHEDVDKNPKFSNVGYRDLSTSSFDHDVDSIIVNLSKTLVYDDLSVNEVDTLLGCVIFFPCS